MIVVTNLFYLSLLRHGTFLLAIIFLVNGINYGQKPRSCEIKKDKTLVKYKIGSFERGDEALILHVSLNPNNINEFTLLGISKQLKMIYCKEKEIIVTFFDNQIVARNATLNSMSVYFEKTLESSRGEYYLNRDTGEEFVSYSTSSGYLRTGNDSSRIKIVIGVKKGKQDTPR